METFSALLALCAGNSPVTDEVPSQRPVTRSFDVFFDLPLNKRFSKHLWGWWFKTPSCSLWRRNDGPYFLQAWLRISYCLWTTSISTSVTGFTGISVSTMCPTRDGPGLQDRFVINSSCLDKMAAISQTIFSDAFSWMKSFVFWLKFHWSLFLRV